MDLLLNTSKSGIVEVTETMGCSRSRRVGGHRELKAFLGVKG